MKNQNRKKINILMIILILLLNGCNPYKKINIQDFGKKSFVLPKNTFLNLTGKIAFQPHTGEIIEDSSAFLNILIPLLKQRGIKSINIITFFHPGGKRMMFEGFLNAGNMRDFFVKQGIVSSIIHYESKLDKNPKYSYNSIFRKVVIYLKR